MPAVNKLMSILQSAELEVVMVDAGHQRFIDLYCQPCLEEDLWTTSEAESEEDA